MGSSAWLSLLADKIAATTEEGGGVGCGSCTECFPEPDGCWLTFRLCVWLRLFGRLAGNLKEESFLVSE